MWRYSGSLYGLKQWEDVKELDAYMTGPAVGQLGLPQNDAVRYMKTDSFRLFPAADVASGVYANARDPMAWVTFSTASNFDKHVNYVEGGPPAPASPNAEDPAEAAISKTMADDLGIQVGEDYVTFRKIETDGGTRNVQIPVRMSGIWSPKTPRILSGLSGRSLTSSSLSTTAPSRDGLMSELPDQIGQIVWYWLMDGSQVHASDANRLVAAMDRIRMHASTLRQHQA